MAHAYYNAIFNTFRRSKNQVLYVVPPFVIAYFLMDWAEQRYIFTPTHTESFPPVNEGFYSNDGADDSLTGIRT